MTTSIGSNIATLIGAGTGVDTTTLVSSLVSAARTPRQNNLTSSQTTNNARISALASATSALDTFATALTDALKSSSYAGQPASNDPTIASVALMSGGTPKGLPAQLEVKQLATARSMVSTGGTVDAGSYTLNVGGTSHSITITGLNNTPAGLAAEINNLNAGVTAAVVTDVNGTRLMLKGQTGAANDFSFSGGSMSFTSSPAPVNSIVDIDGVEMINASNSLENAIPYVKIDLNKAAIGTKVTLGLDAPTSSIKDVLKEFVSAYNTLRTPLNQATAAAANSSSSSGALAGDAGARDMLNQLARLTTTPLATSGSIRTLSDMGISTNRDGTLKLDEARFDKAYAADPNGIAQLISPSVSSASTPGLAKIVTDVQTKLESDTGSLKSSKASYEKLAAQLTKQLEKLDTQMTDYEAQLNKTYTAMQTRLSSLKATNSYMTQQIAAWNNSDN